MSGPASTTTRALALVTSLALLALGEGCGAADGTEDAILVEVTSEAAIESLEIHVKRYIDDRRAELYDQLSLDLAYEDPWYVLGHPEGRPLRLLLDLPETSHYAVHLVGRGRSSEGEAIVLTATFCGAVDGRTRLEEVFLGLLPPHLDGDGDTFPEELTAYCQLRQAAGLPCDLSCHGPRYAALVDCNPPEDLIPEPSCGALPESSSWHPMAADMCADCFDQDCFGGDAPCPDEDGDGFPADEDCDDDDPHVHPEAAEVCGNGVDDNCAVDLEGCVDGDIPCDVDEDGFRELTTEGCGQDCDDGDGEVHPAAFEGCGADPADVMRCPGCNDGIDNNCNGRIDEGCFPDDIDQDGVVAATDCNDCDSAVGPGFLEACGNAVDEDCEGGDAPCAAGDTDRDGFAGAPAGSDCDDDDPHAYPGAPERCGDGVAQGCAMDSSCESVTDDDGDLFAGGEDDCDDTSPEVNPWAAEECDEAGVDEDCDGQVNEVQDGAGIRGCGYDPDGATWYPLDFRTDGEHCGTCRHRCEIAPCHREGTACVDGECSCDGAPPCSGSPEDYCCAADDRPAGCRDLTSSTSDCGGCGYSCKAGEVCEPTGTCGLGECFCPAEDGPCPRGPCWACCGESGCVNLCADPEHCGACFADCTLGDHPRGDLCSGASPEEAACLCGEGRERCAGAEWCTDLTDPPGCGCADLDGEPENCGSCDLPCDAGEACVGGECSCQPSGEDCSGAAADTCCPGAGCVNVASSTEHCGTCGNACAWGETCESGECRCGASEGCDRSRQDCCDGDCYAVETDEAHCGPLGTGTGCSRSCRPGSECTGGSCGCEGSGDCSAGETCCPGAGCADLSTDEAHCGDCDTGCRAGEQCTGGSCSCTPTCSDGNDCTEDSCVSGRCAHATLDGDDDGYCAEGCPDGSSGSSGDCTDGDCDDSRSAVHPGATETCSTSYDDDCDGNTNDQNAAGCTLYYFDSDDDLWGTSTSRCYCRATGSYTAAMEGDCDDTDGTVHPGAAEVCNGDDDDCASGTVDGADESWLGEPCDGSDGDLCEEGTYSCTSGSQVCSDTTSTTYDDCDGFDNDCDGSTEDGFDECPGYCCGGACQTCCSNGQCPGSHNVCISYTCSCDTDWGDCAGTCDCNYGGDQVCCAGTCYTGDCCSDGDCDPQANPNCDLGAHECYCAVLGIECPSGFECCNDMCCPVPCAAGLCPL